jgi:regulator of sirC expression with transglutaminase-like and TPR domain
VDALEEFGRVMSGPDPALGRAAALIAAADHPGVTPEQVLAQLDALAERSGGDDAETLVGSLFGPGGLEGDSVDYYSPDNSLLDRVLERRRGMPITLAVVAIEVGRRRGVPLVGVGMPGHFLLRDGRDDRRFFDVFDGGTELGVAGARALFTRLHGPEVPFGPEMLNPTPDVVIIARVLNNLLNSYTRLGDRAGMLRAVRLLALVPGSWPAVGRRLAQLLHQDGRFDEAAKVFEQLAHAEPELADQYRVEAARLRARLN